MKILGIDPGTRRAGWGVIEVRGEEFFHLEHGVVITKATMTMGERLFFVCREIEQIVKKHNPGVVCLEETFCGLNRLTSLRLGYIFGALLSTFASIGVPAFKYPTKLVKRIVAEKGSSSKDQVEIAVMKLLSLAGIDNQDSSDALAVAIGHALISQSPEKYLPTRKKPKMKRRSKKDIVVMELVSEEKEVKAKRGKSGKRGKQKDGMLEIQIASI